MVRWDARPRTCNPYPSVAARWWERPMDPSYYAEGRRGW